ncbi:melanoma-associated antigen F1-like isoform X5 [Takifugu rubripes]|uniref:melanoma-associated antigen F1-like isoform X5 n=1 Tax=Takifugu rubripes TaxID=31033 RepID=UPI0005D20A67|nr:melanoma-associated antigen F1-like isoform X5 [Takifugu rubripes]XP_029690300.1 melanoma-associated antigen F1-like isoform X5 [Takifugu rubripes]|eukprot:XP_011619335.1 PREDICTED: melanoma-associated antigen F1-like isoform X5 [Takifugu rubripes]
MTQRGRSANPPRSSQAAVSPSIHPSIHRHSGSGRVQEDDDDSLFTQPTTSQVQRGLEKLTPAQVERKTAEVVQFILVKDQKKFPIRRADLIRVVLKEYKNIYPEVMKRAARTFEQVFGLRLMEIDPKNHLYILQNNLEPVGAASPETLQLKDGPAVGHPQRYLHERRRRQRECYLEHPEEAACSAGRKTLGVWGGEESGDGGVCTPELHQQDPKSWSQQYREAQASSPRAGTSSQR